MPHVSVITIFLNAERFLDETLASLRRQTLIDWELVLVDDGSTDAGSAMAREAASASAGQIRYFEHDGHANLGLAASRNRGLHEARGEHVLYLDSDDLLFPEALATLAGALDRDPRIALASAATLFWNWDPAFAGEPDRMQDFRHWAGRTVDGRDFLAAMIADETLHPANCSTMIRRQAMLDIGGFDPAFRGIYEDTSLMTELLVAHRIRVLRDCLSAYRMHASSHCHTAISEGDYVADRPNAARLRYLEWARGYLAGRGLLRGALGEAVTRTLREQQGAAAESRLNRVRRQAAAVLGDPLRLWGRIFARPAETEGALAAIERFYRQRGAESDADLAAARRISRESL